MFLLINKQLLSSKRKEKAYKTLLCIVYIHKVFSFFVSDMYLLITLVMCSGSVLNVVISVKMFYLTTTPPKWLQVIHVIYEPPHVISNNVAFLQVSTQTSLCSPLLSLETPNYVQLVAKYS